MTALVGKDIHTVPVLHVGALDREKLGALIGPSRFDSEFENPVTNRIDYLVRNKPGVARGTTVTAVSVPCNLQCPSCILHGNPCGCRVRLGVSLRPNSLPRRHYSGNLAGGMRCA